MKQKLNSDIGKQLRWVSVEFVVFAIFALTGQENPKILATLGVSVFMAIAAYIYGSVAVGLIFNRLGETETIKRALTVYLINYVATLAAIFTTLLIFDWLNMTPMKAIVISAIIQFVLIVQGAVLSEGE